MSNKFKIRNLENEKRRIDKLIKKLKEEETKEYKLFTIYEERECNVRRDNLEDNYTQMFIYEYTRKGKEIKCRVICKGSSIEGVGVARCHNDDDFNLHIGCSLAERRAIADFYIKLAKEESKRHF